jgi:uncharacterized membrane protein
MANLDDYFMWKLITATVTVIFAVIYFKFSLFKKYGYTGLFVVLILIVVLINLAQWKAGYVSPFPRYRLF